MNEPVSEGGYEAARTGAAVFDRSDRGRLRLTGADRRSYLQGLLTNDIAGLEEGRGCYAAYLTPQGRMIADVFVYELGDAVLLNGVAEVKDRLLTRLDELVFAEDVQVADVTAALGQIAVLGPEASRVLAPLVGVNPGVLGGLPAHGCLHAMYEGEPVIVTSTTDLGVPGFDVYLPASLGERLVTAAKNAGAAVLDPAAAEVLRIEGGIPLFGRDMDEETIPLEAGIEDRAISFTKGCYVGQEVIVRVLHRGHGRVARKLVGLRLEGAEVPAGTPIMAGEREVGRTTSGAWSPRLRQGIGLGYIARELAEPGTEVAIDGSSATVSALPLVEGP